MITIAGNSDIGKISTNNEDIYIAEPLWDDSHFLAVVIDGVGGQEGGEVAAAIAKERIKSYLLNYKNGERERLLKEAVTDANNVIFNERMEHPPIANMSCVLTACIVDLLKMRLYMAHVGDTRLYRFFQNQLTKLSHDHSLVGYREEIGDLTEEEAMNHPQRNIINRDVGSAMHKTDDDDFIETQTFGIRPGSTYLLCTDGLSDMISSSQIKKVIATNNTVEEKALQLIEEANNAGGKDNITVVLINFPKAEPIQDALNERENSEVESPTVSDSEFENTINKRGEENSKIQSEHDALRTTPYTDSLKNPEENFAKAKQKKRFYWLRILTLILIGFILGITIDKLMTRNLVSKRQTSAAVDSVNSLKRSPLTIDSINLEFIAAQKAKKDSFSLPKRDTILLTKPLIISTDHLHWIQKEVAYIRSGDPTECPIAIIIISDSCKMNLDNVNFSNFKKKVVDLGKDNKMVGKKPI